jgi:hypothetical protein
MVPDLSQLTAAVERQHNCTARLVQSVPVREKFMREPVWEGVVHVFEISGHPKATTAYAWSSPIEGSDNRRFFAVLHQPPVTSPVKAVRAAIVAEHRTGRGEND